MIKIHSGKAPVIHESAFIASTAVICGDVRIGANAMIMYGAAVIAEGGSIEIGDNCIVLENAVLRSTAAHSLKIGSNVLIGPNAHVVGCMIEDYVFVATGASIFHGARLRKGSEVRINGTVHIRTELPEYAVVPIGWIAVGIPAEILPAEKHDQIWAKQEPLNFYRYVYGVDWKPGGKDVVMPEITQRMAELLGTHKDDTDIL